MSPPPPFPGLDLIPRGREGPCPFPRDFVYGSVCPSLSCCSCSGSAFTPAAFPGGLPRMIGAAFPEVPWTHVSLPKTAGVACSERLTHVGTKAPSPCLKVGQILRCNLRSRAPLVIRLGLDVTPLLGISPCPVLPPPVPSRFHLRAFSVNHWLLMKPHHRSASREPA